MNFLEIVLYTFTTIYCFSVLLLIIGLFRTTRKTANQKQHPITVILSAHNEEEYIEQCLKCLADQNYPKEKYEVIIANDRSDDRTPEIIKKFCSEYSNFKSVDVENSENVIPKKTALIKGLDIAKGEIVVSTDADCITPVTWLSDLNECFTDDVGLVIGHTNYIIPNNVWKGIDALDYFSQRALGAAFIGIGSAYTCTASNFAYRKEIFDKNRDELTKIKIRPAEDNFLLHRVHKKSNYKIAVAIKPGSFVTTNGASGIKDFMNQRFRWSAYGGNITTAGIRLFFIPTLIYYPLISISLIGAFFNTDMFTALFLSLICKVTVDFLFMIKATTLYNCLYLLKYFLPISLIHLFLVPIIVLWGNLLTFQWKGRRYTKEIEI